MNHKIKSALVLLICSITFYHLQAQTVINGPYLVEPGNNAMSIRWELDKKADYFVEYGKDTVKVQKEKLHLRGNKFGGYLYEAELRDLKQKAVYYYRLAGAADPTWYKFRTFGDGQKKVTFVAMGDSRSNPDIFKRIMEETSDENPDFCISMGDLVESGGNYRQWHDFFFSIVKGFAESIPIVSTLGDHEGWGDGGELFRYYLLEDEPVDKQWFSFDYGIAHFISLDYRHPEDKEMIDWFINDIKNHEKEWNFVYMHRGAYNFGGHGTSWGKGIWPELFSKYKIDIVFAGHSHLYERFFPARSDDETNAVTYITTGGAGAGLYQSVKNKFVLAQTESVNHFVVVKIDGNKLSLKAIRMDGTLLDELEVVKNKKGYNKSFEEQVVSSNELNTMASLNSAISGNLPAIPFSGDPVKYKMNFQSYISESIPFSIQMNEESAKHYKMEVYKDTLQGKKQKTVVTEINRTGDITLSLWGEVTPELHLKLIYEYHSVKDTITGKAIGYWP